MNAHSPKRASAAREVPSPLVPACPAEQLGREIQRLYYRQHSLEDVLPGDPERSWNGLLVLQLADRLGLLRQQLQWVKAQSLAGLYAQTCELRRLTQASALEAGLSDDEIRAVERLSALIDRSQRDLGGFADFEMGGLNDVRSADDFAEVLMEFTGADVREA